ncbi:triose-phosphate isomerase [uncultured Cellulomonas sp.]|uniref:triose-phosphate isomerase n=1 Tax=uncultured Cellulomonas sp. TaxID=189682 RepID=UPI002622B1F8|nr:triose-phosphate isomerase [uncultured Cellulomonas sp.]
MTAWVGTSWKMTKTLAEARGYADALATAARPGRWPGVQPFVIPPATALTTVRDALPGSSGVLIGAQNAHWQDAGAWTGEVSVPQVADAGARLVEIGHSERREHFGDTDEVVRRKVGATLRHGLVPLVCVGEPDEVRLAGGSTQHVLAQVDAALTGVADLSTVLIAYEPVWAIGEHGRPAEPGDIAGVVAAVVDRWGDRVAGVLYGGSVSRANALELMSVPGISGLFIGRAAWDVDGYVAILDAVAQDTEQPVDLSPMG